MNVSTIRKKFAVVAAAAILCPLRISGTEIHAEQIQELHVFLPVREYMASNCPSVLKSWHENPTPQAAAAELACRVGWAQANDRPALYPLDEREAKTNLARMKKLMHILHGYVGNLHPGMAESMERAVKTAIPKF